MADIELIIKIDEEDFEIMKHNIAVNNPLCPLSQEEMVSKVANGIPLPKGHGDLIDKDRLLDELEKTVKSVDDNKKHLLFWDRAVAYVHLSEPIIEAESEKTE